MSSEHFRGSYFAFKRFMQMAQDEIDRGERKGARRIWPTAHPKVAIGWMKRRILRGEFKARAK